jgi:hypothetical protein
MIATPPSMSGNVVEAADLARDDLTDEGCYYNIPITPCH